MDSPRGGSPASRLGTDGPHCIPARPPATKRCTTLRMCVRRRRACSPCAPQGGGGTGIGRSDGISMAFDGAVAATTVARWRGRGEEVFRRKCERRRDRSGGSGGGSSSGGTRGNSPSSPSVLLWHWIFVLSWLLIFAMAVRVALLYGSPWRLGEGPFRLRKLRFISVRRGPRRGRTLCGASGRLLGHESVGFARRRRRFGLLSGAG